MAKRVKTEVFNYRVIIEKEYYEDGTPVYTAYVPTLDIADYGDTIEETLESLEKGIKFHIECLIEEGKLVPAPDDINNIFITTSQVEIEPSKKFKFAFA